jgi:hypothetical protein
MSLRMWPALASWGAGLIHLAVAAAAPPAVLALFVLIGAVEIVWGVLVLRAGGLVTPRIALGAAVAIVAASVAAALAGVMAWLPLASSTVFVVFIAGACALAVRRGFRGGARAVDAGGGAGPVGGAVADAGGGAAGAGPVGAGGLAESAAPERREPRPGRTITGLLAGAAIVAALTTPALAATDAGEHAVPHGEMPGHSAH